MRDRLTDEELEIWRGKLARGPWLSLYPNAAFRLITECVTRGQERDYLLNLAIELARPATKPLTDVQARGAKEPEPKHYEQCMCCHKRMPASKGGFKMLKPPVTHWDSADQMWFYFLCSDCAIDMNVTLFPCPSCSASNE